MSLFFVRPLERGGKGWSVVRAVARRTLTPEELDSCWYCQHCGEAMLNDEDGLVDPQSRVSFCSEGCRDEYVAEGWNL